MGISERKPFTSLIIMATTACGCHIAVILISLYIPFHYGRLDRDIVVTAGRALDQGFYIPDFILVILSLFLFKQYKSASIGKSIVTAGALLMAFLNLIRVYTSFLGLFYMIYWITLTFILAKEQKQPNQAL